MMPFRPRITIDLSDLKAATRMEILLRYSILIQSRHDGLSDTFQREKCY